MNDVDGGALNKETLVQGGEVVLPLADRVLGRVVVDHIEPPAPLALEGGDAVGMEGAAVASFGLQETGAPGVGLKEIETRAGPLRLPPPIGGDDQTHLVILFSWIRRCLYQRCGDGSIRSSFFIR